MCVAAATDISITAYIRHHTACIVSRLDSNATKLCQLIMHSADLPLPSGRSIWCNTRRQVRVSCIVSQRRVAKVAGGWIGGDDGGVVAKVHDCEECERKSRVFGV